MHVPTSETLLSQSNPLKEAENLERQLSHLLGQSVAAKCDVQCDAIGMSPWAPAVDISEDDTEYAIQPELPDMKKDDITLNVHNNVLTITGERKNERERQGRKYHCIERAYGSFRRSFMLPEDADGTKVTAEYKDGLLNVRLPKSKKANPNAIEVSMA